MKSEEGGVGAGVGRVVMVAGGRWVVLGAVVVRVGEVEGTGKGGEEVGGGVDGGGWVRGDAYSVALIYRIHLDTLYGDAAHICTLLVPDPVAASAE